MAEVLIRAADAPVPDSPGKWLAGAGVVVMPDGHVWGQKEGPPTFIILKFPRIDVEELRARLLVVEEVDEVDEAGNPGKRMVRRRVEGVLQSVIDDTLAAGGTQTFANVRIQHINNYLRRYA